MSVEEHHIDDFVKMPVFAKLSAFLNDGGIEEKAVNGLAQITGIASANDLIQMYWGRTFILNQLQRGPAELFQALLDKKVKQIQNFNDGKARRRVYAKPVERLGSEIMQTFVMNGEHQDEEWVINSTNLKQGTWVAIPDPSERVSYGLALEALTAGYCDYIRCEDWIDQNLYLRLSNKKLDGLPPTQLVTLNAKTLFCVSMTSQMSKQWIMIRLPRD